MERIQNIFSLLITKPLESIRDLIAPEIPGSGLAFCKIAAYMEKNDMIRTKTPVIIFHFVPRIIMASIFFIELTLYHKLQYFISSLILCVIPLCWNLFVNLFTNFGERILNDMPKYVKITPLGEPLSNGWYLNYSFKPLPQYTYAENDMKEYEEIWFMAMKIYALGKTYLTGFKNKISPYITILTSSLYLSASLYKLIYILF